jgi:membrane protease YdiL (CAAX protease family)
VPSCEQCGAASPPSATWCSQCYLPFAGARPVLAYAGAIAGRAVAPQPLVPVGSPPPPPPISWPPPPHQPRSAEDQDRGDGRLLDRKALVLVVAAIGLGGVAQLIAVSLAHVTAIEPEALIRYDIVLTVGMYAVVAAMIVSQITPSIRLRWGDGRLVARVGYGAGVGVGISVLLLAVVSAASGHLQSDPRIVLLMSEGDPTHIIVTVFIGCVAAPLVEETLFRGLLLESLRPRGTALAVLVSAGAFAVWHFMPASLVYYAALGAALGGLYIKRGLACSIAAHVGFNAVLTIAAIAVVLGPSHVIQAGALSMTAPSGWSLDRSVAAQLSGADAVLIGPDLAELEVVPGPAIVGLSADAVAQRLRSGSLALPLGLGFDTDAVNEVRTPVGEVAEVGMTVQGRQGTLALLVAGGQSYEFVFLSAGSDKAQTDFARMLSSLRES